MSLMPLSKFNLAMKKTLFFLTLDWTSSLINLLNNQHIILSASYLVLGINSSELGTGTTLVNVIVQKNRS